MATSTGMHEIHGERSDRGVMTMEAGGSLSESLAGIAAIVLAIIGLTGVLSTLLASIITIIIGGALMIQGGSIAAMYTQFLSRAKSLDVQELGGGLSAEFVGGVAGIVLGILALIGVAPMVLVSVSIIVFGAVMIIGAGVLYGLGRLRIAVSGEFDTAQLVAREVVKAAAGTQVLVGLAVVVLGILSVIGLHSLILSLVAFLAIGGALFLSGTAIGGRMWSTFRFSQAHESIR